MYGYGVPDTPGHRPSALSVAPQPCRVRERPAGTTLRTGAPTRLHQSPHILHCPPDPRGRSRTPSAAENRRSPAHTRTGSAAVARMQLSHASVRRTRFTLGSHQHDRTASTNVTCGRLKSHKPPQNVSHEKDHRSEARHALQNRSMRPCSCQVWSWAILMAQQHQKPASRLVRWWTARCVRPVGGSNC